MKRLSIDIETFSDIDIKSGVFKYTESPYFCILLLAYAYDDEDVKIISLAEGDELSDELIKDLTDENIIKTAFNAMFEMTCIEKFFGFKMKANQWECTMVHAYYLGLGGGLAQIAKVLNSGYLKNTAGTILINYFSKPCKPTKTNNQRIRNLPAHDVAKWEDFKNYCKQDVLVEREIKNKIEVVYKVPDFEKDLWCLDYEINNTGVYLNLDFINQAIKFAAKSKEIAKNKIFELSGIDNPKSIVQIKNWIEDIEKIKVDSIAKKALPDLKEKIKNQKVLDFFGLYEDINKTSVAKYPAMTKSVCADARVKGILQFNGASRTGRWAGRLIQVHNLPRNYLKEIDDIRNFVLDGNYDALDVLYPSIPGVLSELLRTSIEAPAGYKLVISDFSAIEARIIAWLSNEKWRLDVFEGHGRIYEASASQMFNVPIEEVTKGSLLRQKGKIAELALGYQGSVGALKQMGATDMGLKESELEGLVTAWRIANPSIKKLWANVQDAAIKTVAEKSFNRLDKLEFYYKNRCLFIKLPSGREICYVNPVIGKGEKFGNDVIKFIGYNQTSKKHESIEVYGGKLVENIVQAIARDCLAITLMRIKKAGYKIIMHIHDEIVVEVPETEEGHLDKMNAIMSTPIKWADGLVLKSEGFYTKYYMKD